ncbi:uncharacterized protein LOC143290096 [Babylonia areolata]|uniref:uncharacterized protein LOC143290096 n=1 Tax=Babylonia areolata TaxID=304850 RepID=UPI003FD668CC
MSEEGHVSVSMPEEGHVIVSMPEEGHVIVSMPEVGHVSVSMPEVGHVNVSMSEEGHVSVSMPEEGHVNVSMPEEGHVTVSMSEVGHVIVSMPDVGHVSVSMPEEGHVIVSMPEEGHVTVSMSEVGHVIVSMPDVGHVSVSMSEEGHVIVSMPEVGHVSVSMSEEGYVSVSMPEVGHVIVSMPEVGHVSVSMPEVGHVNVSMPEVGHVIISMPEVGHVNVRITSPSVCLKRMTSPSVYLKRMTSPSSHRPGDVTTKMAAALALSLDGSLNMEMMGSNLTSDASIGGAKDPHEEFYEQARFITGLVIYPIICILGLCGNVLCIIVMSQRQMRSSTNVYLLSLAVSDGVKLISDLLYFIVVLLYHVDSPSGDKAFGCLYPYAHYIFNCSLCVSAWLTVSVAFERYIYVCHPTKVKTYCNIARARTVSFTVFFSMSLLAIPYAMRYRTVEVMNNRTGGGTWTLEVTELWQNRLFADIYTWVQNFLRSIIPLLILIALNVAIIYGMRRCRIGRSKSGRRHRITVMLIFVILIFLVCITPDAVMSTFLGMGYYEEAYLQRGIREITDLLLLLNSACNFVLYCIFNTIFWKNFVFLFCSRCYPNHTITEDSNMRRLSLVGRPGRSTLRRGSRRTSKTCNGWTRGGSPLLDHKVMDCRAASASIAENTGCVIFGL